MAKRLRAVLLLLIVSVLVISGCDGDPPCCPQTCPGRQVLPPPDINAVPDTLRIGSHSYYLISHLWRDFMPPSSEDGDPMIASVNVVQLDSLEIPSSFNANYLWVINDLEVWGTGFCDEDRPPSPPYVKEFIARGGPKWDTGIEVDVIVRISATYGVFHYLKQTGVFIDKTI